MRLRPLLPLPPLLPLLLLLLAPATHGSVFPYASYRMESALLIYREAAQYATGDAPAGDGPSVIDLSNLGFHREDGGRQCVSSADGVSTRPCFDAGVTTSIQVAIFRKEDFDAAIGYVPYGQQQRHYCCAAEDIGNGECTEPNTLIVQGYTDGGDGGSYRNSNGTDGAANGKHGKGKDQGDKPTVYLHTIFLPGDGEEVDVPSHRGRYEVRDSGIYVLLIASCDPTSGDVVLDGHTEWINPYGYLPGDVYGCLPFFGVLTFCYGVIGMVWMVLCWMHKEEIMNVQMWITLVIALGMIETATMYFDYTEWNNNGMRSTGVMVFGIIAGTTKRALSRVLVLMVSMGYGVVKPTLGPTLKKILLLGGAYFVLSLTHQLMSNLPSADKRLEDSAYVNGLLALIVLLTCVDVAFYLWILQSLTVLINYLSVRKQSVKLTLYQRFRAVLIVSLLFSIAWATYSLYMGVGDHLDVHWDQRWTIDAIWEVCYLLILASIAFLWAPSKNSQRYAYSVELTTFDDGSSTALELEDEDNGDAAGAGRGRAGGSADDEDQDEYGGGVLPDVGADQLAGTGGPSKMA